LKKNQLQLRSGRSPDAIQGAGENKQDGNQDVLAGRTLQVQGRLRASRSGLTAAVAFDSFFARALDRPCERF
jgi:hypothetical protein